MKGNAAEGGRGRRETGARLAEGGNLCAELLGARDFGYCLAELLDNCEGKPVAFRLLEMNSGFRDLFGVGPEVVERTAGGVDLGWEKRLIEAYGRVVTSGRPASFRCGVERAGRFFDVFATAVPPPESRLFSLVFSDISDRVQDQRLLTEQTLVLETIASGRSREDCLRTVADAVSGLHREAGAWVLMTDERGRLQAFGEGLSLSLGQGVHAVGLDHPAFEALHAGEVLTCADVAGCRTWPATWRDLWLSHGILAWHWSPVLSPQGAVVASFLLGLTETREPNTWELRIADFGVRLIRIILERDTPVASDEPLRTLADHMTQLAWIADACGRTVWYSQQWFEFSGKTSAELLALGWQKLLHPDHRKRIAQSLQDSWASAKGWEETFPLRARDGTYRWFLSRAVCLPNQPDDRVWWLGTNTDVTDQRAAQDALLEANRRKDDFLATLAHELRNPLAPIRTGLEVMRMAGQDLTTVARVRNTLERQTTQLARLVDDLLDVSRISSGKLELRFDRVALEDVVQAAVEASRPQIEAAGHRLVVNLPRGPVELDADPHRLIQVLSNLLNNAAKYTPEGGRIKLWAEQHGPEVVLVVEDNGVGIPEAMRDRIFDMFVQVERPQEQDCSGLGIGLSLVKALVEMHGGTILIETPRSGQGTAIKLHLPATREASGEDPQAESHELTQTPKTPLRVLVVDDNPATVRLLSLMVRMLGHEVRTAGDGLEALERASDFLPDLVLMDLSMPQLDGYQAAAEFRRHDWGRRAVLVALTGWGREEFRRRALDAGFDDHLVKPAEPADLRALLSACQERHRRAF